MGSLGYRNHLFRTWFLISRDVPDPWPGPPEIVAERRLNDRFHQNFVSGNNTPELANDIAVRILGEILTAAPGATHGFGIPPGNIQPQGTRTSRAYLDYLISLTQLSAEELSLRYRIDLTRPDSAMSTEVDENIATLQAFFRDGFQDPNEPDSIIPAHYRPNADTGSTGLPPFYLQYDEWVAQDAPFFSENHYLYRYTWGTRRLERGGTVRSLLTAEQRAYAAAAANRPDTGGYPGSAEAWAWIALLFAAEDAMEVGYTAFDQGEYAQALASFLDAEGKAEAALSKADALHDAGTELAARQAMTVHNGDELLAFQARLVISASPGDDPIYGDHSYKTMEPWREAQTSRLRAGLVFFLGYVLPMIKAEVAVQRGEFAGAVQGRLVLEQYRQRYEVYADVAEGFRTVTEVAVAQADRDTATPYLSMHYVEPPDDKLIWQLGALPYATLRSWEMPYVNVGVGYWIRGKLHAIDLAAAKLRQGSVLLEWADALYRSGEAASVARARELYKGALWLHDEMPAVYPTWGLPSPPPPSHANPEIASQAQRGERGLYQIDAGLNYYGFRPDLVPPQRYRPLKDAADRFAAFAKSAQQDFLAFTGNIEAAIEQGMRNANLLAKANLQGQLAAEQVAIALDGVNVAQLQVQQVNDAINAKVKEIADHDSLFTQFSDYVSGLVQVVKGLPDDTKSTTLDGFKSALGVGAVDGVHQMAGDGFLGLGEAGSVMAGFGIFTVASYMSLTSMADAANKRQSDLATLQNLTLPIATAQLDAKQHELKIAGLQQAIAQADAQLASALIAFQAQRLLSAEFWANLASLMRRLLRRYLELGARCAWLAERALAYEQDRELSIVRLDYYPLATQLVTGADLLQADLAELEASRIAALQETVPVKHTYSMARDFPLELARLKSTGSCTFQTTEAPLRLAYPGTYGYRIQAVTPSLSSVAATTPPRGLLTNQGVSSISRLAGDGSLAAHVSARPPDALPISEFRLRTDGAVYGLPDETLLGFEGSGLDTLWRLDFPAIANPNGLQDLVDILFTVDVRARYSNDLYVRDLATKQDVVNRMVLVSARAHQTKQLEALRGGAASVELTFDLAAVGLPASESERKVTNLVLMAAFSQPATLTASLHSQADPAGTSITLTNGSALSVAPPLQNSQQPQPPPLNKFVGENATQPFRLTVSKSHNSHIDFSTLADIVLGIEYSAKFTS